MSSSRQAEEVYNTGLDIEQTRETVKSIWEEYSGKETDVEEYISTIHDKSNPQDIETYEFSIEGNKFYFNFRSTEDTEGTQAKITEDTGYTSRNILEPEETHVKEFIDHLTDNWL